MGIVCAALAGALLSAGVAVASSTFLVQNVDTDAFPTVKLTLVVPPELAPPKGEMPTVRVVENGVAVEDVVVRSLERERKPIDVVLLIDTSGSMRGRPLEDAKSAARRFVESMEPEDRIAVISFAAEPRVVQEFTTDRARLSSAIGGLTAAGDTTLYDGLVEAARLAKGSQADERYVVVLSDGSDTQSLNSADSAAKALLAAGTPLYAIALQSGDYNPVALDAIAKASRGRMTTVADSVSLGDIYESIAEELQQRFEVEYRSTRPNTPQLELAVALGDEPDAPTAQTAVPNPDFAASAPTEWVPPKLPAMSVPMLALAIASAFAAGTVLVVALGLIFRRDRAAMEQLRFYDQLHTGGLTDESTRDGSTTRGRLAGALADIAERRGFTGLVQRWLDAACLALRANEYIFFHILGVIAASTLAYLLGGGRFGLTALALAAGVVGPILFLRMKADARTKKLETQLPDILDLIAGSLRTGWGIQQALDLVVSEIDEPARTEFARAQAETRLGLPVEEALHRMAERVGSDDLRWTVAAVAIQREVGGNLAEVLNTVGKTIRERAELKRQVRALTAEGRFSAVVLTILPFAVFVMLFVVNPEYIAMMLGTPIGLLMLGGGALLLLVGVVWLNRVVRIEV
jgi:tight adherence protein B